MKIPRRREDSVSETKVVDWRVWKAATVAAPGPPIQLGAPRTKPGDVLYVITTLNESPFGPFSFITPSATSLALSVAVVAAKEAVRIRGIIKLEPSPDAVQAGWLSTASLRDLY